MDKFKDYTVRLHYEAVIENSCRAETPGDALRRSVQRCYFKGLDPLINITSATLLDEYGNVISDIEYSDQEVEQWVAEYKEEANERPDRPRNHRILY